MKTESTTQKYKSKGSNGSSCLGDMRSNNKSIIIFSGVRYKRTTIS